MRNAFVGPNALNPGRMTAAERIAEVGRILTAGFLRLGANNHTSAPSPDEPERRDIQLDFSPTKSRCHAPGKRTGR